MATGMLFSNVCCLRQTDFDASCLINDSAREQKQQAKAWALCVVAVSFHPGEANAEMADTIRQLKMSAAIHEWEWFCFFLRQPAMTSQP